MIDTNPLEKYEVQCKVCHAAPICLGVCHAKIIYLHSQSSNMSYVCIHLGVHNHLLSIGVCRDSLDMAYQCVANEVAKTLIAKNSTIVMAASKMFWRITSSNPLSEHMNKWKNALYVDGYYVVGVTSNPYHGYGCVITIVSKKEKTYIVFIAYIAQCNCLDFAKILLLAVQKRGHWVSCKHLYYVFMYLCKVE